MREEWILQKGNVEYWMQYLGIKKQTQKQNIKETRFMF